VGWLYYHKYPLILGTVQQINPYIHIQGAASRSLPKLLRTAALSRMHLVRYIFRRCFDDRAHAGPLLDTCWTIAGYMHRLALCQQILYLNTWLCP